MSTRSGDRARRWTRLISGVVLAAGATAILLSTILASGLPVHHVALNDGGIWVTSDDNGLFGRLNRPAGSLDTVFNPPGGAQQSYALDVLQDGSAVVAWDRGDGQLYPVDVARGVPVGTQGQPAGGGHQVQLAGGTLALLDSASGHVWATRVDPVGGIAGLAALARGADPIASVNRDGLPAPGSSGDGPADPADPADPAGNAGAGLAVGVDGSVHAVSSAGRVVTIRPSGAGFAAPEYRELGRALNAVRVTAVGPEPVVLDAATGDLVLPGDGLATLGTPGAVPVVLQQPGPAHRAVVVATGAALFAVSLADGAVEVLYEEMAGAPAEPVRLSGCVYAAWAGPAGGYARSCGGAAAARVHVENGVDLVQPVFRVNRGAIVLNDVRTGQVWDLLDERRVDNWSVAEPPPQPSDEDPDEVDDSSSVRRDEPPRAVDDVLGARPGRTTLLHVLDNDSAPAGTILSISAVTDPDHPTASLAIAPDGQTVAITVTGPGDPVNFTYTIDDGRHTAQADVTVEIRDPDDNEVPTFRTGHEPTQWTVTASGRLSIPVLADWRDFDGDPISLVSAVAEKGAVSTRPEGWLEYVAPAEAGTYRIDYEVSDGRGEPAAASVDVTVIALDAPAVAPITRPDVARGQVHQPVIIHPLDNDLPGADPANPTAGLALAGEVNSPADAVVVTNLHTGTVVLTAARPGPYFLDYTVAFGNAPFAEGVIRVDVVPEPASPSPPVAMPDDAVLHGQLPTVVDVLVNDFDPAGGVLSVLHAEPVSEDSSLQVAVVDGRWLRINSLTAASTSASEVVRYTISNGLTGPVTGEVNVTRMPDPPDTRPVPADDVATVRAGESVTVAVLDNDTNPGGAPLMLAGNVPDAPAPGQLVVHAPHAPDADDPGVATVVGNLVRYVAPSHVTAHQRVTVDYVVQNADGDQAVGHLHVTVTPPPSETNPNRPPAPLPIETRAVAGRTVTVSVPTSGVDADGDQVSVLGIGSAPALGRITAMDATSFTYEAFPSSAGTDSFTYLVQDRYGAVGQAGVRVGVTPPGPPQPPVAVNDHLTAAPGARVYLDVLANDVRQPDDVVTILPLADRNPELPAGVSLASPAGPIEAVAPGLTGEPLVVVYAITNGIGAPSIATATVRSQEGYNNPPTVFDSFATPEPGETTVTVEVLDSVVDPDGDQDQLRVTRIFEEGATVVDGVVTLAVADIPRTVTYEVRDDGGATALGLIHVAVPGGGLPYVRPGTSIVIDRNGTASVDIAEHVVVPSGRAPRLTTVDRIWSAPGTGLIAANDDERTIALTAVGDYVGPASLVFEVTDGESLTDPQGRTAVVSIPVQVGPPTPVLRCPTEPIGVVQGGPDVIVDVPAVCSVWHPDPEARHDLEYAADWASRAPGVDLDHDGGRTLELTAGSQAVPGTTGVIDIAVPGTDAAVAPLHVVVTAAPLPAVAPVVVDGVLAGDSTTVDLTPYVRSSLRDPVVSVVAAAHTSGMPGTATIAGSQVTLTPNGASHGQMTFTVTVTDVADTSRGDRHATGRITLNVLGVPDPPGTPSIVEELNRAVRLSWNAPANNGAPIDEYEVSWSGGTHQCAASPCLITGLTNGTTYTFTVRAHNLVGWSEQSAASPPAVPDTVPGAVTGLVTGNPQDGTLDLTWVAPPNDGTPVERYDVTWSGGGAASTSGVGFTATGLDNNTVYTFTVVAINAAGPGPGSQATGQSAGAPPPPQAPTFDTVNSADNTTRAVVVSWPAVDPNGPGPTTYTLTRTGNGTVTVCADVTATSCADDGIAHDGTVYTYTVTAANAAAAGGSGHVSPPSPGTQMEATATPDPITNYSVTATGVDGQAQVSFNAPASHGATNTVTCTWSGNSCGTWSFPVAGQSGVTQTIAGLPNGQSVTVSLQACNGSSGGTGAGTPCNTPVSAAVTTYGPMHSLTISTSASGPNVHYTVSVNPNGRSATVRVQSTAGRDQTFTTGVGVWSMNFTDNVGHSTTNTITVTVSDPGRTTLTQQASQTTPPPPPSVTVAPGDACGPATGTTCPSDPGGGCSATCWHIVVTTANFSGNVTCSFNSSLGSAGWHPLSFGPNETRQTNYWFGQQGGWVSVTCGGVTGMRDPWIQ
jgi:large repetitive protein